MTVHSQALALAAKGIPCFPCLASKAPACPDGFKAATADPVALLALWRRHPGPLVGVPTGPVSGLDALDIDPRHGGHMWERDHAGRLPATRIHVTRSGGRHYFFRHHQGVRNSASLIAPGIDVRGNGGFVIWWPAAGCAVLRRAPVAVWPDWLLRLILSKPPPLPPARPVVDRPALAEDAAERMVRRVLYRLETAPQGERHPRLCAAARTIGGLLQSTGMDRFEATRVLFDAVKRAGGDAVADRNALATIVSGLEHGAASPFRIGGRDA